MAVGTRHGKERQLAPAFDEILGARLVVPADLDTDQYGTFSGEVARTGSAVEVARAKARLGMRAAGVSRGLASEASYGPSPGLVGCSLHEEILLFVDDVDGFEVLEGHRAATPLTRSYRVRSIGELPAAVVDGVAEQALIVLPYTAGSRGKIIKGITQAEVLRTAIVAAAQASDDGAAVVEPDLRAHHNPGRQQVLSQLAYRLARRLATSCPSCRSPGYGRVDVVLGLPCRECSSPTTLPLHETHACAVCPHHSTVKLAQPGADPGTCPRCNP
ncbi:MULTISPECIES: DUF6671 family protein [Mycobacteriaceae]|jgi:hypothetical protein|uniref:DUF6671 family protein n=1 Tax=Mycobacteriaceae TaxID=1762 RepID=UPI0009A61FEF|nr:MULTISPECIES: DUF6671 family protein [Mycobacteriaceae]MBE5438391.1 hypothetical protein [Mycobacteroides abscessus]MBN7448314.1 hypothetical protein [Mycobacteroides abscessus subsp. abscessus]MDM1903685.1 hypothetical protein [Mycobacteroides abscessus]MDM2366509.1 hypothetical protein [Mycobacteroides abscessus]MDM2371564.1 hypothetical protein [Mycobacteroides abscessus]